MRGIVMDIKGGKAIIFQKNGNMVETKDKGYKIGQTINVTAYSHKKFMAVAACFAVIFIAGISGHSLAYRTPSSYIYIDINPSVRLDVNCFDKVISVVPLNEDAVSLVESYPLQTADTEQCMNKIVSACFEKKYLNERNDDIEIDVVTDKSNLNNRVLAISEKLKKDNWKVSVKNVNKEENSRAMKYRTSPKRLKAVEAYTNAFGGTLEDNFAALKGITNEEIYTEIEVLGYIDTNSEENLEIKPKNRKYNSSPERLKAVKEYTDTFGGTLEENMKALKGKSTKDINTAIENGTPLSTLAN
ncbi:anti-sigma-I factor RsgI family protein [Congzhengia minquanensis]|uniref:RsgI N-terminal anti-sigma domain-containing protein n=1 Tax=Congzhengia minquanensis TaxID=2763657 RepID=A0A926DN27_9FIRM|nr:hypothetical protein [Congzhengia minquanensis]MBC8540712.1 hypothetical protein [Congzhengia minquanensis]